MIRANHPVLLIGERAFACQPLRLVKGLLSAYVAYPLAERREERCIRPKLTELRRYYRLPYEQRQAIARNRLVNILHHAKQKVPYYRDLFTKCSFDPEKIHNDIGYLNELPYLTKEIIQEQGVRMLSCSLNEIRHYPCKTGGSTGLSTVIYYDQEAIDYSAAVTLYARERIGKRKYKSELHFACRFPDAVAPGWPTREDWKCFAMNRSNIFFDRIDDAGLEEILNKLKRRRPYLIHEHPSTIYALACYVERKYGSCKTFEIFESSGELLQPYMREKIAKTLCCQIIDRYGLAELGVMAYELEGEERGLQVLESEGWPEHRSIDDGYELIFTGYRNFLMPLIRYATGDHARVVEKPDGVALTDIVGRIHDVVPINGVAHPTHHIMDMLDHRVGGIQEFQIDLRSDLPRLRIVTEPAVNQVDILKKVESYWPDAFQVEFVGYEDLVRVGWRSKFRHVVTA